MTRNCMLRLVSVAFVVLAVSVVRHADGQVMGCGGFIKSKKNIDFSRIEVELHTQTPSGSFRKVGSTDCSPTNGYYFLPVDQIGVYQLKPVAPRGWKVAPEFIDLKIDGKTDPCSKETDMNFEFVGFGVTGAVRSKGSGSQTGPKGLTIELSSEKSGKPSQTAETDENGGFVFFGVSPGKYHVRVSDEAQNTFSFTKTTHEVDVGDDVASLEPFYIDGYTLSGKISAKNFKIDLKDILFTLRGLNGEVNQKTRSDTNGNFKFSNVEIGDYVVAVESGSEVEIEKKEVEVSVGHHHSQIPDFLIKSFTVSGKILSSESSKKPLAGVKVEAGHFRGVTDKNGVFEFKGLQSHQPLILKALLDGYDFETVTFDPKKAVYPARYRLSGLVDRQSIPPDFEMKVKFSTKNDEQVGKVLVAENGKFSIYLPSGTYLVSVELQSQAKGIGFAPVHHTVNVIDRPLSDINFQPVKADIKGKVKFLDKNEDEEIEVTLSSTDGSFGMKKAAIFESKFHFKDVLPGRYKISVSESGNRCWKMPVKELTVSDNIDDIVFQQVGFYVTVDSVHNTLLILKTRSGSRKEAVIEKGSNTICVESEVEFSTKGCESFEIKPKSLVPSPAVQTVTLRPTHYEVSGRIFSKKPVKGLELSVKSEMRNEKVKTSEDTTGYGFSLNAFPGEELTFTPTSEEFLFEPEFVHVYVENSCHLEAVQFEAVSGFFIRGQITPPVQRVSVKITNLPSGTASRHATASTDKEGRYKLGPLPEEPHGIKYLIEAKLEGFIFEKVEGQPGNFKSKKLAKIVVRVVNVDKKALSGAVISVSGGERFRSNVHTSDEGVAEFLSLSPGEYFVKPQLKEFEFKPKHKLTTIKEGEMLDIKFEAKRVAFSAFGHLVSLNGEPESGVTLRAKGVKPDSCLGLSEDATSESKGDFRFRGLVPGCHYSISLRDAGGESLIPEVTNIVMEENDMKLKKPITVMRTVEIMDLQLMVHDEDDPDSEIPIKVTMTDHQAYTYTVKRFVGHIVTLPSVDKDKKLYTITVETLPEKYAPKRKAVKEFYADEYYKFLNFTIKRQKRGVSGNPAGSNKRPISWKSFLFFSFIAILLAAVFRKDQSLKLFQYLQDLGKKKTETSSEDTNGDALGVVAGGAARRRTKKRLA